MTYAAHSQCSFPTFNLKLRRDLGILVQQRKWEAFAADVPRTDLCKDLTVSPGKLGIGAFPASEMRNMKVNTNLSEPGTAVGILENVLRKLTWPLGRASLKNFYQDEGKWYVGIDLYTARGGNPKTLQEALHPPSRDWAWFGYQGEENGPTNLAVWLSCDSEKSRKRIARRLRNAVKKVDIDDKRPPDKGWFGVIVKARGHSLNNDNDWFCTVFKALGLKLRD